MAQASKPTTVDEYIGSFDEPTQSFLARLRALSREAAPQATEGLRWGSPAYFVDTILFVFAGYARHANFVFTPSTKAAFSAELSEFTTGKGSIQLPYDQPVPCELLKRMIAHRIVEFDTDGVRWM